MASDSKENNSSPKESSDGMTATKTGGPPSLTIGEFPGEVEVSHSESSISKAEADFRRGLQKWGALVLLVILLGISGMTIWLVFQTARGGSPEGQKLAFGLIGTVLGVLWSNFTKLMESASKR